MLTYTLGRVCVCPDGRSRCLSGLASRRFCSLTTSIRLCCSLLEAYPHNRPSKIAITLNASLLSVVAGREGASKIFQMPLSAKLVTQNRMNKTPVLGALSTASAARRAEAAALEVLSTA